MDAQHDIEIVLDLSKATPDMLAALAKAQAEVQTVGKDGRNKDKNYNYSSAEAMIRGSRKPLGDNGLAFLSSWTRQPLDAADQDIGNQFVCANVKLHFALTHASGGVITGTAEMDAIGSRARPPDKAVAATLTYMRGFLLRDLLNMDRADEDADAVDRRDEGNGWSRGRERPQQRREKAPPIQAPQRDAAIEDARNEVIRLGKMVLAKAQELGWKRDVGAIATGALGKPWDQSKDRGPRYSAQEYEEIRRALVLEIESLDAEAALREKAETDMQDDIDGAAE